MVLCAQPVAEQVAGATSPGPRFVIRPTVYAEVAEKSAHLFEEHWDEVALNKRVMVLKPDVDRYLAMEKAGLFFSLAAFDGAELVGYSGNFIGQHLHYADLRYASNDVLFVSREHRNSPLGLRLIRETEKHAKRHGAQMVVWHAKEGSTLEKLMRRLGYGTQDILFSKEL